MMHSQWKEHHLPCFVPGKDTVVASTAGEYDNAIAPFGHQVPRLVFTCLHYMQSSNAQISCAFPCQAYAIILSDRHCHLC